MAWIDVVCRSVTTGWLLWWGTDTLLDPRAVNPWHLILYSKEVLGEGFSLPVSGLIIQGVPGHWTPGDLAKSQALYEIRHLENIQVSSSCL